MAQKSVATSVVIVNYVIQFCEKQFEKESFGDTFRDGNCDGSSSALNIDICGLDGGDCCEEYSK